MNHKLLFQKITVFSLCGVLFISGCRQTDQSGSAPSSSDSSNTASASSAVTQTEVLTDENKIDNDPDISVTNGSEPSVTKPDSISDPVPDLPPEQLELYTAYQNALSDLLTNTTLPDGQKTKNPADYFTIQNVDGDETEELVLVWSTQSAFGNAYSIYKYDIDTDQFHVKWDKSTSVKLYNKGTILIPVPVNYGLSSTDTFYPYGIYQYNPDKNTFDFQAYVDAWQKSYLPSDYDGNPYPSNLDTENAGMVYCISYCKEGDDYVNDYNYSQSQYSAFCEENFGTEITTENMTELSSENIRAILTKTE
ncbi:MAG: hypothetical protein IJ147_01045 [Lachnospiraceae bacterium]|nr:hypothetical protein [Lachnospiraceae bacterium]